MCILWDTFEVKKPIDFYQLLSSNLFWFVTFWLTNPKYDLWDIFPLIFCPWTQIYKQNAKRRTNIVFSNSLHSYVNVMMVDFKRLYLLLFLNSAWKFVFRDKNWVEKMPHKSFLDWLVKVLQMRRGCMIKVGNNLWAFSP